MAIWYRLPKKQKEGAQWGNPLQNSGCSFQLVQLEKLQNISVGEILAKFRLFSSVSATEFLKKIAQCGNHFQNNGCFLQLVEPFVLLFDLPTFSSILLSINLHWNPGKTSAYTKNCLGWSWIGNLYLLPVLSSFIVDFLFSLLRVCTCVCWALCSV